MIKLDLITGFLGSGKTTLIKQYASYLMAQGYKVGILENDFGAINVDMMLLQDIMGEQCELEMISGGCDKETYRRRYRTKLISMGMSGYDRVLVEPSGIYDVEEFFDALYDAPLDRWYEAGSVIAVVDANLEEEMSGLAEYLLAAETASAGCIVLSKGQDASEEKINAVIAQLNRALEKISCGRSVTRAEVLGGDWEEWSEKEWERLSSCGFVTEHWNKQEIAFGTAFESLYFMKVRKTAEEMREAVQGILQDPACGRIFRIKGFMKTEENRWIELNATQREQKISTIRSGQEVLLVIGEALSGEAIGKYLGKRPEGCIQ